MPKHEFYADPTLFDQWQSTAGNWLCARGEKVCPYAWVIAFTVFGTVLVCISMVLLGILLQQTVAQMGPAWNHSLARGVTSVVALATAQWLFRQALDAWPCDAELPGQLCSAARCVGWRPAAGPNKAARRAPMQTAKPLSAAVEQDAVQAFFAGVKAAGVNVAIARALLAAGIRSPRQLLAASDDQLVAIRGVGPVTVRKLRAQFG
jgi:hypothetical protein